MFKKLFGQGGGHGGGSGGGGGGTSHSGPRQVTATSTQKTVDAIQKLGEVHSCLYCMLEHQSVLLTGLRIMPD